jgi:purine-binding chemotaxis protein CheW
VSEGTREPARVTERLLTFEVGGTVYALPIADVSEVTEVGRVAAVPMLPPEVGGVTNHHGDALPVVHRRSLFAVSEERELPDPQHLLVLAKDPDDPHRYGVQVDRILGLVDGPGAHGRGEGPVAERRPIEGRLVSVLDPRRLLARATQVIQSSVHGTDATHGGE